jgi:hypothetical protein
VEESFMFKDSRVALVALLGLLSGSAAQAASDEWQFGLTPYLWLPSVDAKLGFETPGAGGSADMTNLLKHLSGAFFLNADASKGPWGLSFDIVYCSFDKKSSQVTSIDFPRLGAEVPIDAGSETGLWGTVVSLSGTYALIRSPNASFDGLAGFRYTHIGASLDWSFAASVPGLTARTGSADTKVDLWDGIVGVRGRLKPTDSAWFMPLYLDVGAGTSQFTWQGLAGVGYSFSWGDLLLVYRKLSYDQGDTGGLQHLSFSGAALGATFRF